MSRDNWERLVAAVLKREQLWQLFHEQSRSPSISSISSGFSGQIINLTPNSVCPSSPVPQTRPFVPRVSNNASGPVTLKLFPTWYQRRKSKDEYFFDIPDEKDLGFHLGQGHVRRFSLHELQAATENFSDKNVIEYGYNVVYRGQLADGCLVAVKRHRDRGTQSAEIEFQKEVEINSISAHSNVLHMLGVCITPKELLLVYPLMVNGSVASCLRDRHESQVPLDWPKRKRIALGAARGLAYLHEECGEKIILRDIKAANILLDEDFEAVFGDFELAIIMDYNVTHITTHILGGTIGHIAPEYLASGICSEKTDVFGYGIFLLELVTSRRAFELARVANEEDMVLLDWVKRNLEERKWEMLVDPDAGGNNMEEVVKQLIQIALLCTQITPQRRPKMSKIVRMLQVEHGLATRWEKWHEKEMFL